MDIAPIAHVYLRQVLGTVPSVLDLKHKLRRKVFYMNEDDPMTLRSTIQSGTDVKFSTDVKLLKEKAVKVSLTAKENIKNRSFSSKIKILSFPRKK